MSNAKKTVPWIPVGHPEFKWTSGSDVQALWRKHGWTPPSEKLVSPPPAPVQEPAWFNQFRRVK
jgi:hypothetical protein